MHKFRNAAIGLAALSTIASPIAASAATGVGDARATSNMAGANDLGGGSSWIIGLVGLLAGVAAIVIIAKDDDDAPVSP